MTGDEAAELDAAFLSAWRDHEGDEPLALAPWLARAGAAPEALADLVALDFRERRRRGLSADLSDYEREWPALRRHPEVLDQVLTSALVERDGVAIDEVVDGLSRRHPELSDRIALLAEFCALTEEPADQAERVAHYDLVTRLGSGAFGEVWKAWDGELGRFVALKLLHPGPGTPSDSEDVLAEARLAAGIDHPNVVKVHRAGFDAMRGVYWIDAQLAGEEEGGDGPGSRSLAAEHAARRPAPRTAAALVRDLARGVAAAHARGVIHRDLKPANVVVTASGRPLVTDFGLAATARWCRAVTTRRPLESLQSRSDGVVGTPLWMAPEQARGEAPSVRSDVYGLGAILGWLLTGRPPVVVSESDAGDVNAVLERVRRGEVGLRAADGAALPRTLAAIARRALAADPAERHASAAALADDLDHFLDHRPTSVDPPTLRRALLLAVRRHRAAAVVAALALLVTVGLTIAFLVRLQQRVRDFEQMADVRRMRELLAEEPTLWPRRPARVPAMDRWLGEARALLARRPLHAEALRSMPRSPEAARRPLPDDEARAVDPGGSDRRDDLRARLRHLRSRSGDGADPAVLEPEPEEPDGALSRPVPATLDRDEEVTRWRRDVLSAHLEQLDRLAALVEDVERRRAFAATVRQRTVVDAAEAWARCLAELALDRRFATLRLEPVIGLVPLGRDPTSGLQEFAHEGSGARPRRRADGTLEIPEDGGIVLVLLPGGRATLGADPAPGGPRHDPSATGHEVPVHAVDLAPFLLSKHEMTQAQWRRVMGAPTSFFPYPADSGHGRVTPRHPVEDASWFDAVRALGRYGLELPTEARWEYAARGGTSTRWWTGDDARRLEGVANLRDESFLAATAGERRDGERFGTDVRFDDGHVIHREVGGGAPNPFGLDDVVGNVAEWCCDWYASYAAAPAAPGDGRRLRPAGAETNLKVFRGGDYLSGLAASRSSARHYLSPRSRSRTVGIRPAMTLP